MKIERKTHNRYFPVHKTCTHLLQFGTIGFKNKNYQRITQLEINTIEWIIRKHLKKLVVKKKFKFWKLTNFNRTLTKLNLESRMGKGKGSIFCKSSLVNPGTILFEFDNLTIWQARNLAAYLKKKFSIKFSIVSRPNFKIGRETQR
uniref:ribosomal protein L16 n=1 Tax=Antithamnionella miharai TaxID=536589 RepID=UPI002E77CC99|nr:ribosomal protein L16 [Antithamnionella miharai]WQF69335.1 ribosomal protein L16 [Antithamnionella miharai]WQF69360.1 ribosomal protein L16 [Antithamnionella miharai]